MAVLRPHAVVIEEEGSPPITAVGTPPYVQNVDESNYLQYAVSTLDGRIRLDFDATTPGQKIAATVRLSQPDNSSVGYFGFITGSFREYAIGTFQGFGGDGIVREYTRDVFDVDSDIQMVTPSGPFSIALLTDGLGNDGPVRLITFSLVTTPVGGGGEGEGGIPAGWFAGRIYMGVPETGTGPVG